MSKKINRIGEEKINNFGSKMIITRYENARDLDVYFPEYDWTFEHAEYRSFKNGKVKCPYEPRYYGKGYLGEGKYKMSVNRELKNEFNIWYNMLQGCYDAKYQDK